MRSRTHMENSRRIHSGRDIIRVHTRSAVIAGAATVINKTRVNENTYVHRAVNCNYIASRSRTMNAGGIIILLLLLLLLFGKENDFFWFVVNKPFLSLKIATEGWEEVTEGRLWHCLYLINVSFVFWFKRNGNLWYRDLCLQLSGRRNVTKEHLPDL